MSTLLYIYLFFGLLVCLMWNPSDFHEFMWGMFGWPIIVLLELTERFLY